jgi:hypothetical protein
MSLPLRLVLRQSNDKNDQHCPDEGRPDDQASLGVNALPSDAFTTIVFRTRLTSL